MKKVLSVLLAVIMIISVFSVSFTVFAEGKNGVYGEDGELYYYKDDVIQKGWIKVVETYDDGSSWTYWYYGDPTTGALARGWKDINGKTYYFNDNMFTGINEIDGKLYYFNQLGVTGEGSLQKNGWIKDVESYTWTDDEGNEQVETWTDWYYADANGVLATGWKTINSKTYYFDTDWAYLETGVVVVDDKPYYIDESEGLKKNGWVKHVQKYDDWEYTDWFYADKKGVLATGWKTIDGKKYYFSDEISWPYMYAEGIYSIGDDSFYFYDNGVLGTGWIKREYSYGYTEWFYGDPTTGALAEGWKTINSKQYYFTGSHSLVYDQFYSVDDQSYLFDKNGAVCKTPGWVFASNNWYYITDTNGNVASGWKQSGSNWYYLQPEMAYGGSYEIEKDDKTDAFLFTRGGLLVTKTGWQKTTYSYSDGTVYTNWYYVLNSNGNLAQGWKTISKKKYYFNDSGLMIANRTVSTYDESTEKSDAFLLDANGVLVTKTGWNSFTYTSDYDGRTSTKWVYVLDSTGKLAQGWKKLSGKWYYFSDNGIMASGGTYTVEKEVDGNTVEDAFLFDSNGALVTKTGWNSYTVTSPAGDKYTYWVYVLNSNGNLAQGWKTIGSYDYYFYYDGTMAANGGISCPKKDGSDNTTYLFDADGHVVTKTGWQSISRTQGGKTVKAWFYVADKNGTLTFGWKKIGNYWYYFENDGEMCASGVYETYDSEDHEYKYYGFDANGHIIYKQGWVSKEYYDGWSGKTVKEWYYINNKGLAYKGWQKINNKWYYFSWDRTMVSNGVWETYSESSDKYAFYAFDANGVLYQKAGWFKETYTYDGRTYTYWYYLNSDGTAKTGWQQIGGKWYYLEGEYGIMETGWSRIDGYWYYFGTDGIMTTGTKTIEGKSYTFKTNGICNNP